MASTSLQGITSSPASSPPGYIYDVFLGFRGKDTRNNFTSHLYSNLVQRSIHVYMDDRKLERGETIEPALWKAIEESRFSVIVFSRDYASSPWYLDELVKIVQCMKEMGQTVLPVFYDVVPSEVAEQKEGYEKAFIQHENNFEENLEKVRSWKDCLTTTANLSSWDVRNRNESESIKIIVEYILFKLNVSMPTISKYLVGIDSRLEVLNGYIGEEVGEAIFIGVCGMGGIGKTTLARVVYDRIRWQFEGSCFLANVREVFAENNGSRRLQEQLLSEILMERATVWDSSRGVDMIRRRLRLKKILLILDDVDDQKQLEFLATERGWFGPGSIIIITSRDNKVLTRYDDARFYEAEKLNDDDALILFSQKAFKNYQPAEDFMELSKQVVGYASGLPLTLEVIGSFLHGRVIHEWRNAIDRLNEIPDCRIILSPSFSPPEYIYDVFLSFRGKDTRNNFTSHLYSNLVQRGIDVFMDDRKLERGETIEPALWKAIEESRFSIIVFSRDYASSPWCLDELVKIVQCMKEMRQTVLPVFYDVVPSEVAEQKGGYEKAFVQHENNFEENLEKVQSWKDCLTTVANLSGWDVRNRNESESIKIIVEYILFKLNISMPTISKYLVGIDSRLEVLNGYIGEEVGEAIFIGICGMGGIGKTTLARVVYDRICWQFEGSCFLANVREVFAENNGSRRLQEQLLSEILMERATVWNSSRGVDMIRRRLRLKKILLILDDVDDQKQHEFLAAERGWFGPGSIIIITSRDNKVLTRYDDARIYEAGKLNDDDALMLFSQKAFKNYHPAEDFMELSKQVVGYASGLPLALIHEWRSAINRINDFPDDKINGVLRISFDGLHELEKKIFLDIACFLKGFKKDQMIRILDGCGFHASIGTRVLIDKSLISVSRDQVWMHNLLQIMDKEIVRREYIEEPGRRSRLWTYEDVCFALMDNTGKEKIEAIFLDMPEIKEAPWNRKAFSKMINLRLLKINNVQLSEGPEHLSNKLRFLEWHFYPSKSLPACLQVDELVELHMPNSSLEELWYGHKSAIKLEIIDLSNSLSLVKTPEFTGIPNLKRLILEGCTSLYEVHPSLGHHKKLQYVNLVNCKSVTTLPSNLEMESLEVFSLDGCSKLEKFPDIAGNMNKLMVLCLDETGITELSSLIHHLIGLGVLSMNNCKNLTRIPEGISYLKLLKKLDLSGCSGLKYIPENLGGVESLEEFDLSGTSIKQLLESIFLLKNLKVLSLDGCRRIVVMPSLSGLCSLEVLGLYACHLREGALLRDIGCLSSLMSLDLSGNNFVSLPTSINKLFRLEMLVLEDCRMLESLLEVPSKVQTVNLNGCIRLKEIPDPIKLSSSERSEFLCLNCWELYKHNDQGNMGSPCLKDTSRVPLIQDLDLV